MVVALIALDCNWLDSMTSELPTITICTELLWISVFITPLRPESEILRKIVDWVKIKVVICCHYWGWGNTEVTTPTCQSHPSPLKTTNHTPHVRTTPVLSTTAPQTKSPNQVHWHRATTHLISNGYVVPNTVLSFIPALASNDGKLIND